MTHADALAIPPDVVTKEAFYAHVIEALQGTSLPLALELGVVTFPTGADLNLSPCAALLAPAGPNDPVQQNWLSQLANAASLLFGSYENYASVWGREAGRRVNWAGEYPNTTPTTPLSSSLAAH